MADNLVLNAGSGGATLATDDIGGIHYQLVKVVFGALDAATLVSTSNPLPVDLRADNLAGNLDINLAASAATVTVDSELPSAAALADATANPTVPAVGSFLHGFNGTTWDRLRVASNNLQVAVNAALPAGTNNIGDVDVLSTVLPVNRTATGTITALNGTVTLDVDGAGTVGLQVSGTWTATLVFEATVDGSAWFAIDAVNESGDTVVTSLTANANVLLSAAGWNTVRVRASAFTSGTIQIDAHASGGTQLVRLGPSDVNIGNVDIASLPNEGQQTMANSISVAIASDQSAVPVSDNGTTLSVDDGGGSLTVDGSVSITGALPAGTNNIGDVDVLSLPSLPAGTNNIGDVDVASLPATALAAGNLVQVDYDSGAGTQNMPMVGLALPASGGAVAGGTSTDPIRTDPTGTTTQPISGTVTANAGTGTFTVDSELPAAAALADAAANPTTPTVGSAALMYNGTTWDRARGDTTNGLDVDVTRVQGTVATAGNVAHDAADSGNPVKVGGVARTANPAAVANGDRADLYVDDLGRPVMAPFAPRDLITHNRIVLSSTTETTLIAAGGAGVLRDIVFLALSNESATEVRVDIRDATAGTVRFSLDLAPDGGGGVLALPVPLTQSAANNNWTAQLSAAVSSVYITAIAIDQN